MTALKIFLNGDLVDFFRSLEQAALFLDVFLIEQGDDWYVVFIRYVVVDFYFLSLSLEVDNRLFA